MAMRLSAAVLAAAAELLQTAAGDRTGIRELAPVTGGDINQACRVTTGRGRYLLKHNPQAPPGFFAAEAAGLRLLAGARAVRVPRVHGSRETPALLLLEWIETTPAGGDTTAAGAALGTGLAALHRQRGPAFGLDQPHYLATLPQPVGWHSTWAGCWRERLAAQAAEAGRRGRMAGGRARRMERLLDRLEHWLGEDAGGPALLHGDLWGGNWMIAAGGEPVLIDPAAFYGSREVDLAMTELFGGFPPAFYAAYRAAYPLPAGYPERRPLYQLYYLLAHLNLFGEGYGAAVDGILQRYAGG